MEEETQNENPPVPAAEGQVCGAQLRGKPGVFCQKPPLRGRTRCALHGGKSLAGAASPSWQRGNANGRYSRVLNGALSRLSEDYERAVADPDLMNLSSEIGILETLTTAALRDAAAGETPRWSDVQETLAELRQALRSSDNATATRLFNRLDNIARDGAGQETALRNAVGLMEQRRRLTETEIKRRSKLYLYVTAEEHRAALRFVADAAGACFDSVSNIIVALIQNEGKADTEKIRLWLHREMARRLAEYTAPAPGPATKKAQEGRGV